MDAFSSEAELVNIHTAFYQSLYQKVVDFDTSPFSDQNKQTAQVLKVRALLAQHKYDEALKQAKAGSGPEFRAAELAIGYFKTLYTGAKLSDEAAVGKAEALAKSEPETPAVQLFCSTVLAAAGKTEEALANLVPHRTKIDIFPLVVQLYLTQNRLDLAKKEVEGAREWAQDNIVMNLAESWVFLREGGDHYQSAYYVFEELDASANTQTASALAGQAVSEIHLGRLSEAEESLKQSQKLAGSDPVAASCLGANLVVLKTLSGQPTEDALAQLDATSQLAKDLAAKKAEFVGLLGEYQPQFAGSA